jgi:glutathione S-transferase
VRHLVVEQDDVRTETRYRLVFRTLGSNVALELWLHPLSSFCQKVLIALYENDTPFTPRLVDFADEASAAAFRAVWPVAKIPVLRDLARGRTIPESSVIVEYLAQHHPGPVRLLPEDPERALQARLSDRFFDLHVAVPMQKIVTDRVRPDGARDPFGVAQARAQLETAYALLDRELAGETWALGDEFGLADCAAAPALFYAGWVQPFEAHPNVAAYFRRLLARPSFARAVEEAKPYRSGFPAG